MASIGNSPTQQAFTPAIDYFSGNGSTTAFTLSRPVASVAQVQVVIDNVAQNPSSAYTVSSNTITFTSAPLSGTNNIYVYYTSPITQVIAPGQGTVNTTALGNITNIASGNSSLTLQTGSGNTTAVTVNTSQNVGIGTASPVARLTAVGSATVIGATNVSARFSDDVNSTLLVSHPASNGNTAILVGNGQIGFATNDGANTSERMRIDSSGNVGIGTSSPSYRVDAVGSGSPSTGILRSSSNLTNSTTKYGYYTVGHYTNATAPFGFIQGESNSTENNVHIGGGAGEVTAATRIDFYTAANNTTSSGTERMRIDSSGNVGIGTNVPATYGALAVRKGVAGTWYGVVGNCSFQTSDAAANSFSIIHNSTALYLGTDTSTRLQMFCSATASGGVYLSNGATSWTSASDERVKENLIPIENGLTKVASLRAVTGNYINDEDKKSRPFLIAQDVQAVLPEAVDNSNPDELGLAYTDLIPLLVASIKELSAKNDALTARIEALENR